MVSDAPSSGFTYRNNRSESNGNNNNGMIMWKEICRFYRVESGGWKRRWESSYHVYITGAVYGWWPKNPYPALHCWYSPTPVIRTSVIRNLDYPNAGPNVESVKKDGILTKIADSATGQSTCVCVSYVHVQCRHTVERHLVQCEV